MMPAGGLLVAGAVLVTVAIVFVWRRRSAASIASLLAVLAGAVWWSVCSALELSAGDLAGREYWGDLKYVGVVLLPPAYLAFVLQCSGHTRWPRWLGPALALEPLAVLLLLAAAATHDLVRYYPPGATLATAQAAEAGPLFWPHLLYNNAIIWTGTILLIVTLSRMSRLYRGQSLLLVGAILLPIMLNLLFNLRVEPFRQVDLTPFAFVLTTAVLVWGVYQLSLLDLRPVARSQIFRTISDPVLVLDPDGRVLDANPAAGRLAGLPLPEVVGQPVGQLLPTWKETVAAAMAAGTEQATPEGSGEPQRGAPVSREVTRDGRIYDLAISALPERQRQPGGHLVVARDVTERRQVEEKLCAALNAELVATDRLAVALDRERAAAEHLRTLDELKSGFLQAVSHDLRTPLASVLGISLTLQRGRGRLDPADTDDLLGRLAANARRLDRILTGLLDLDKLDRGIVELRREPVDLAGLVAGVVSEASDELGAHPVSLELLPIQVLADAAKVERVVENLLANAARHTDPGTPIWVRVAPFDRGALLCVDDAGPGIPAEQRESIFRPFQRGPAGATYTPGSGVGLALVAQIASLHDGQAWVEDRAGGGASFRVLLPTANGGR
ncbi:MAG: multi-sensor signal transduction histidine kinase [Actinomycetia bacterium]|jgi:PAS domain S-box-containing protein|nr:multi-sensor signal transduction histidine kinase [Actinomycetes bacterium]